MKNPVARNMPKSGAGAHNNHKQRSLYRVKKQESLDEIDEDYINDCLRETEPLQDSGNGD